MSFHAGISTSASSQPSAANSISTSAGITVNSNISNSASGNTKNSTLEIPKGSIKRVMKLNQEVPNISAEAIVATGKATEDFIKALARTSRNIATANNRRTIKVEDIIAAVQSQGSKMEFLEDAFGPIKVRTEKKTSKA